ncbi:hypothetical protein [Lysinibacillus agricola]|uniref:hypothetical protein n=1 Tax=Lysinibacillus agricola TaxID=2590012 RepID=UPI003C305298
MRKRSANVAAATKAAHRTPPGSSALRESEAAATKRPAGTEINPLFCRRTTLHLIAQSIKTRKASGGSPNAFFMLYKIEIT